MVTFTALVPRSDNRPETLSRAGGFRLDDPADEVGLELVVVNDASGSVPMSYLTPLTYRGAPLLGGRGPSDRNDRTRGAGTPLGLRRCSRSRYFVESSSRFLAGDVRSTSAKCNRTLLIRRCLATSLTPVTLQRWTSCELRSGQRASTVRERSHSFERSSDPARRARP